MATSASTSYNPASLSAEEFISHEEILETLRYAEENKHNEELIDRILEKARPKYEGGKVRCEGLTHREASVLLACDLPEKNAEMMKLAEEIKLAFYRQPHCPFCAALSLELLCERLHLLPLPRGK